MSWDLNEFLPNGDFCKRNTRSNIYILNELYKLNLKVDEITSLENTNTLKIQELDKRVTFVDSIINIK